MQVLVLGGNGYIGSEVIRHLLANGFSVVGLGRNLGAARSRMPEVRWMAVELQRLRTSADWMPVLDGIGAVVNCAGALQDGLRDDLAAIQHRAMVTLYAAARALPAAPRIVQISADASGPAGDLPFLATKRTADDALKQSGLDHVILRPAIVIGRNAHGGSALLRALASFPLVTPLFAPHSRMQIVAVDDVAAAVVAAIRGELVPGADIHLAHPQVHSLRELVAAHRAWLGLPAARAVAVPGFAARFLGHVADMAGWLGWRSPLRSTALTVSASGVTPAPGSCKPPDDPPNVEIVGADAAPLQSVQEILRKHPAGAQDLWFARLYLLKPVILAGCGLFWFASGAIALAHFTQSAGYLHSAGVPERFAGAMVWLTSIADIALGLAVFVRRFAATALAAMLGVSLAYLSAATVMMPGLWGDPLGPLVKVGPAIVLSLVGLAIMDER